MDFNAANSAVSDSQAEARSPAVVNTPDVPLGGLLTLVTSPAHLGALESQWQNLELSNAITPTVFQSFAWIKAWADSYANSGDNNEIQIITGFLENKLVFAGCCLADYFNYFIIITRRRFAKHWVFWDRTF